MNVPLSHNGGELELCSELTQWHDKLTRSSRLHRAIGNRDIRTTHVSFRSVSVEAPTQYSDSIVNLGGARGRFLASCAI
jgi:hypothetical protein